MSNNPFFPWAGPVVSMEYVQAALDADPALEIRGERDTLSAENLTEGGFNQYAVGQWQKVRPSGGAYVVIVQDAAAPLEAGWRALVQLASAPSVSATPPTVGAMPGDKPTAAAPTARAPSNSGPLLVAVVLGIAARFLFFK